MQGHKHSIHSHFRHMLSNLIYAIYMFHVYKTRFLSILLKMFELYKPSSNRKRNEQEKLLLSFLNCHLNSSSKSITVLVSYLYTMLFHTQPNHLMTQGCTYNHVYEEYNLLSIHSRRFLYSHFQLHFYLHIASSKPLWYSLFN